MKAIEEKILEIIGENKMRGEEIAVACGAGYQTIYKHLKRMDRTRVLSSKSTAINKKQVILYFNPNYKTEEEQLLEITNKYEEMTK